MQKLFNVKSDGETIYWTSNYDLFNILEGNRPQRKSEFKKIKNSIIRYGWIKSSIITVGEKMIVCDGQYRLWALKEIKKESGKTFLVGYFVDREMTLEKIQALNNYRTAWKPIDYIESNIKLGNKNYEFIKELMEAYKLPYTAVLAIITRTNVGNEIIEKFRNGEIDIRDFDLIKLQAKWVGSIAPFFHRYNSKNFVYAMTFFLNHSEFEFDEFLFKLKNNQDLLKPVTTVNEYKKQIQKLYNRSRRNKIKFYDQW